MIEQQDISAEARAFMRTLYGENKQITDDNYDKSLAVKCINGTFVGKKKDNVIAYKAEASVPMVKSGHAIEQSAVFGHPELSDLSGRAFDATFTKTMRKLWVQFAKTGNPSLSADISPDGKAKEWPLYDLENKQIMVLDEFNVHPEKESERKYVDWDKTYFLTKYYMR